VEEEEEVHPEVAEVDPQVEDHLRLALDRDKQEEEPN